MSQDTVDFVDALDEVDPEMGSAGPTSTRRTDRNLSLPSTVLFGHENLVLGEKGTVLNDLRGQNGCRCEPMAALVYLVSENDGEVGWVS